MQTVLDITHTSPMNIRTVLGISQTLPFAPDLPHVNDIVMYTALLISVQEKVVIVSNEDHTHFPDKNPYYKPCKRDASCQTAT
jgi:hypothetical protein